MNGTQYVQVKPSQIPDLGISQYSFYPYQFAQQQPIFPLSVGNNPYANGNFGVAHGNVPMQSQASIKREMASANTVVVENANKKQQLSIATSSADVLPGQSTICNDCFMNRWSKRI